MRASRSACGVSADDPVAVVSQLAERHDLFVISDELGRMSVARKARGESDSHVEEGGERKSVGHETTFDEDTADPVVLEATLCRLVGKAAHRLRQAGMKAGGVTVKVRYADFRTVTRDRTIAAPTDASA